MIRSKSTTIIFFFPLSCIISTILLLFTFQDVKSQTAVDSNRAYFIHRATDDILLDGELNEQSWQQAAETDPFLQSFPYDTLPASTKTFVRLTYDDDNIYIGAFCHDTMQSKDYVVQSLKRDFSYPVTDAFVVYFDTQNDKTNGFSFGVSPVGAQREGLIQNGGMMGVTTAWDNKWFSEVKQIDDGWMIEMAIPFKTLRYEEGTTKWKMNFARQNLKINENTSWARVPRTYNISSLAFSGDLIWDAPLKKAGLNISFIPYITGSVKKDFEHAGETAFHSTGGFDAKLGITSSLNLDITVNPDFSQVDVDQQVTNLDRFSIFYPEKRFFFIENSDLFSFFGFSKIRPFFSRKIGLYKGYIVPILGGVRLSGNLDKNWRMALMSMQTEGASFQINDATERISSQNYSVTVLQRKVFNRSNVTAIFVNRQGWDDYKTDFTDFNRIAGLEFNLSSKNNKWRGKTYWQESFTPEISKDKSSTAVWLRYEDKNWLAEYNHEYVGENFKADVGYVLRSGYWRTEDILGYKIYPKSKKINYHYPNAYTSIYWDRDFNLTDRWIKAAYKIIFKNTSEFEATANDLFIALTFPFDATGTGSTPLDTGNYRFNYGELRYKSDLRKHFYFETYLNGGSYFTGTKTTFGGLLKFRAQPWGVFSMNFELNGIKQDDPRPDKTLLLLGPQFEISFSKSIFFTTYLQYNTQIRNVNVNSRFQWRFKPMSDLFIVYTDNYLASEIPIENFDFSVKNRAVVLKLVYWFSI